MDKRIVIAIIDSGIKKSHPLFRNDYIEEYLYQEETNSFIETDKSDCKMFGHGTAIYSIIRECRQFARIINIRLLGIEFGIEEDELCSVLLSVSRSFRPNIINLSAGTTICNNKNKLYNTCCEVLKNGSIIVSAFDNDGSYSFPASFNNVIGVVSMSNCKKRNEIVYIDDSIVNIGAKGDLQRVAWINPDYITISGNSFACAHVTVQIADLIRTTNITDLNVIKEKLKVISVNEYNFNNVERQSVVPFEIKKAVLFPFNKEMHSIIRFQELLSFEISDVYDIRYSSNIGASTNHLLKINHKNYTIKSIDNIDWNTFDTLIIGHMNEINIITGSNKIEAEIINNAISKKKNIYSFGEIDNIEYNKYYCPVITKDHLPRNRFGMLYRISKPVLAVMGTSAKQGKFTLQLELRKKLIDLSYNVGQIGTEPSSLLYGIDYSFPIGYDSSVHISGQETVIYLNNIINTLCDKENDIILVGSQSGTVPYEMNNTKSINFAQYDFLLGVQPDAVILCVNPYDEIDYIDRTVRFIESIVQCKVISIIVFPMTVNNSEASFMKQKIKITKSEFEDIKGKLEHNNNIPVYCLDSESCTSALVNSIVEFFS